MKPQDTTPKPGGWRLCVLAWLSLVSWTGGVISRLGPLGQQMRSWALQRMEAMR